MIAFVEDPTGYKWELITREEPIPEPIAQVMSINQSIYILCLWDSSGETTDNNWEHSIH